jgi:hypothetical protein
MVEVIGLVTMCALVRLLYWSMATESEAERRRLSLVSGPGPVSQSGTAGEGSRQAA